MRRSSKEVIEIMENKRKKLTMGRIGYLRYVKNKNLSMPELHFLAGSRRPVARHKVIYMLNHAGEYDSKNNIVLKRFAKLDIEIIMYQLINKGYNEDTAKTIATSIIENQFDNYLYRSIDLRDYIIGIDLTIELKSEKEIIENLDNQIDFKTMIKESNKR